ncbi:predicted protein [Naegleria gruberi]|uniref:Predicted protein n=1 Tax=Naegleria gruberi TaxID=5762 RepID=D2UX13_NAEGR|nr:uncharacterized protein NAEGRDRAFT_61599 [Naegleria gruberi]EFC50543.1 predicted protein [Naegleria gruberi]|eukprot:XP_002683287.1 predicted protein [Naegleria gruberi strain NEG-M]
MQSSTLAILLLFCLVGCVTCASNTTVRAYILDIQSEYEKIDTLGQRLTKAIDMLNFANINSTLIPQIVQTRAAQLKKLTTARSMLALEMSVLSNQCNMFGGDDCTVPTCSYHGKYISNNQTAKCVCDQDWTGLNCSVPICYSIPATNSSVCSGSGTCISNNTCLYPTPSNNLVVDTIRMYANGTVARSCKEYLSTFNESGLYWIKPDNNYPSFVVHCEQKFNGGGWILISSRNKSIPPKYSDVVKPLNDGSSMADDKWAIFRNANPDLMWKDSDRDEYSVTNILGWKNGANCKVLTTKLTDLLLAHKENTGCTMSGSDYCLLGDTRFGMTPCASCEATYTAPTLIWKEWKFKSYFWNDSPELSKADIYLR